jgi:rRNA maturation protein Nop10
MPRGRTAAAAPTKLDPLDEVRQLRAALKKGAKA